MNSTDIVRESAEVSDPGNRARKPQPFYWSVCRELWENRSIYVAPIIVAVVVLFGFLVSTVGLPERRRAVLALDPVKARTAIEAPYDMAAIMLILTAFVVGVFYCLDALYGERRDRSILFWKSLPISDRHHSAIEGDNPIDCSASGNLCDRSGDATGHAALDQCATHESRNESCINVDIFSVFRNSLILLYGLAAIALWHAPIYGWALLVSGWARRATFLWAVVPFLAIGFFEKITFGTSHFASMLKDRVMGFAPKAFAFTMHSFDKPQLTPGTYLISPGLWFGLIVAVVFVALAIRLRRYRGPL